MENLAVAEGVTKKATELDGSLVFETMTLSLVKGDRIEIRGHETFKIKEYEEYAGCDPKTGKTILVKPKQLPMFRMGRELRDRVNR